MGYAKFWLCAKAGGRRPTLGRATSLSLVCAVGSLGVRIRLAKLKHAVSALSSFTVVYAIALLFLATMHWSPHSGQSPPIQRQAPSPLVSPPRGQDAPPRSALTNAPSSKRLPSLLTRGGGGGGRLLPPPLLPLPAQAYKALS